MKSILMIIIFLCSSFCLVAQNESGSSTQREIILYEFQSRIFLQLEEVILDTLKEKFGCKKLDLVSVSIEVSEDNFLFTLSPRRGWVYTLLREEDYVDEFQYGFYIGSSDITYLFRNTDFDLLKQIGYLERKSERPFLPFVRELNNKCLNEENELYSQVNIRFEIIFTFLQGLTINPPSYIVSDRIKR